ncbi:MAG TPA: hypothetical protein VGR92_06895 [Steroidobacteraceae bacterium]|nr:hypothetical protein [Steroidobacteraceae bacterium]
MTTSGNQMLTEDTATVAVPPARLAPRPKCVADTGLRLSLISELLEKHLYDAGVLALAALGRRTALAGPILDEALAFLRREGRIEVRGPSPDEPNLRYALTERGRASAQDALARSGYVGAAPVPLETYSQVVREQSVHDRLVTRDLMRTAFTDVVLDVEMLDRLGPALNSGKAIFVYGEPGTGKTYITQRLSRLVGDTVLVPYAISVGQTVIEIFDRAVHTPVAVADSGVRLDDGHDPRFVLCRRPLVLTGGELVPEMLEVQVDPATRQYRAPLQLKATNGLLIIDDLGRQRVPPRVVLNRWIVPMEEGRDYHTLPTGQHFTAVFDLILVFSTNLKPSDLADEAFLRRIGYKIQFQPLPPERYHEVWRQVCEQHGITYDPMICQGVIDHLHRPAKVPLLPCHPRDLIDMALDHAAYLGAGDVLEPHALEWAWKNYFVDMNQ